MSHTRKIAQVRRKKQKSLGDQGVSFALPWHLHQRVLTLCGTGESGRSVTTIGGTRLPENVLLEIFDFYRKDDQGWHLLVHVCRQWRQIIFESPRRLNLQILCTTRTPVTKNLGIWPAFPIVIEYRYSGSSIKPGGEENVIAALRHPNRVCCVTLDVPGPQLAKVTTVMEESFPLLARLYIDSRGGNSPFLPGSFLGGSAPCLQEIDFYGIPFPSLPTLLLSTNDLVTLNLCDIPPVGHISPEAMVVGLAALPRLEIFIIEYRLATPRPNRTRTVPPVRRTVLPALTHFRFKGASEYLEDLVAQIDSPQLDKISVAFLNQLVDFQVGQLSKFIDRSVGLKLTLFKHADVAFDSDYVHMTYGRASQSLWRLGPSSIRTRILCKEIDWQVPHMAQVITHFPMINSAIIHLDLRVDHGGPQLRDMDHVELQHLLRQFSTVRTLHVSWALVKHVALALEDITEEIVAEVLPSLEWIRLEGLSASSIKNFIAARRLSGRPVTVIDTRGEFEKILESSASK